MTEMLTGAPLLWSIGGDRVVLNAAAVLCLLGVSASLLQLPVPHGRSDAVSGFRGRSLLAVEEQIGSVQVKSNSCKQMVYCF